MLVNKMRQAPIQELPNPGSPVSQDYRADSPMAQT